MSFAYDNIYNSYDKDVQKMSKTFSKDVLDNVSLIPRLYTVRDKTAAMFLTGLIFVYGIYLLTLSYSMLNKLKAVADQSKCARSKTILQALYIVSIIMIIMPLLFLGLGFAFPKVKILTKLSPIDQIVRTQIIFLIFSIMIMGAIFLLESDLKKCNMTIGNIPLGVSIVAVALFAGLMAYRVYKDKSNAKFRISTSALDAGRAVGGMIGTGLGKSLDLVSAPVTFVSGVASGTVKSIASSFY